MFVLAALVASSGTAMAADAPASAATAPASTATSGPAKVQSLAASNDGVPLKYGLFVPEGKAGRLPLLVDVTPTAAAVELDIGKLTCHDLAKAEHIILRLPPFGRGGLQWSPFAERDTMQVIQHVLSRPDVDGDRVYLLGATQGFSGNGYGTKKLQFGTLGLAYHHPDLFAAVATSAGDIQADAYRATWLGDWHQYALQYEFPMRLREMELLWAENLVNTPTWLVVTDLGNLMATRLGLYHQIDKFDPVELKMSQMLGVSAEGRKAGPLLKDDFVREQIAWLLTHKRDALPRRVTLTTNTLKYARNRWLRLDALTELNRFCQAEARWTEDGRLKVRGENFDGFTIIDFDKLAGNAAKVSVDIEHQVVEASSAKTVSFRRKDGKWEPGAAPTPGKNAAMTDMIIDALCEPYILVPGTGGGAEAALKTLAVDTINAVQNGGLATPIDLSAVPLKADTAVRADDMKGSNLVLFGDERTNSIIAKINAKLPIRLDAGKIVSGSRTFSYEDQGLIMVYPNPLQPGRKVVVVTGPIYKGYKLTDKKYGAMDFPANLPGHGFPILGDWIIFRANGKAVAKVDRDLKGLDNAVVEGGSFDSSWQRVEDGPFYFFNKNFAK